MSGGEIAFTFLVLFAIAGMILLGDKALRAYDRWQEKRLIERRNERLRRHNIVPFRGTKLVNHDDLR